MKVLLCLFSLALSGILAQNAHISYSTLSGTDDPFHTVNITIGAPGSTFYDVMRLQGWLEPATWGIVAEDDNEGGKVITSIGGLANNYTEKVAWQLYMVPTYPDGLSVPGDEYRVSESVNKIKIEDNQHFYFIYIEIRP